MQKDQQIITLLEEKGKIFRCMTDCPGQEEGSGARTLFRASTEEAPKGESIMKNVINEGKVVPCDCLGQHPLPYPQPVQHSE